MEDLEVAGRLLYNACPTVKPTWEQLGDTTKSVWREKAAAGVQVSDYAPGGSAVSSNAGTGLDGVRVAIVPPTPAAKRMAQEQLEQPSLF